MPRNAQLITDRLVSDGGCATCGYVPAKHHRLIIDKLERVARGEIDRLALFMPPGSAKSTYATVLYPAWYLVRGGAAIIAASHTAELAERWGRRTRNLIAEHSAILGYRLSADSQAAGRWETTNGGAQAARGRPLPCRARLIVVPTM